MAHLFMLPPPIPHSAPFSYTNPYRRKSSVAQSQEPSQAPPQAQAETQDNPSEDLIDLSEARSDSMSSEPAYNPSARRNSALSAHRNPQTFSTQPSIRTRSVGGAFGAAGAVIFERSPDHVPSDDDIIIVTVRLRNSFRKLSADGADDLPSRPPRRSFLRRMSTRVNSSWDHAAEKEERYKAVKMPRGEYKRYFARDREGNYAGTEPEKGWDEEELIERYGPYQELPLHSVPPC